jgi:hypothetical protein
MSYILLRGCWCDIIVLNVNAPTEDSFYEELERVFNKFPKYNTKRLLGDSNAKVGGEDIFRQLGMRVYMIMEFATSKNLTVKSTTFPHCNIHKFTWTSPNGKTHNQIDYILIDRGWHSSVLDI